jgi:hypothetical protein
LIVSDLNSALLAIKTIVNQGEGVLQEGKPPNDRVPKDFRTVPPTPGLDELTHYAKFQQIAKGIYGIGDVWPVITNPKLTDYKDDEAITALATLFDAAYCYVLCMLDRIYMTPSITPRDVEGEEGHDYIKGEPLKSKRYHLERTFLAVMGGLLYPIAELLVRQPLREGTSGVRTHAGPLFGYYDFKGNKKAKLIELCNAAVNHYPSLGGDDSVLQLCHLLPCVDDGGDVWKTAKHDLALA